MPARIGESPTKTGACGKKTARCQLDLRPIRGRATVARKESGAGHLRDGAPQSSWKPSRFDRLGDPNGQREGYTRSRLRPRLDYSGGAFARRAFDSTQSAPEA